jgi:hypothetical protein
VLPVGMWALAAGTAFTLWQRMRAVYLDAAAKSAAQSPTKAATTAAQAAAAGTTEAADTPTPEDA